MVKKSILAFATLALAVASAASSYSVTFFQPVVVNGQTRFATTAGSYISASDKRLHFGLGAAEVAKVEVHWPSGAHQVLESVKADQFLEVREPEKS